MRKWPPKIKNPNKYWKMYGILIPNHIESIPSIDRVNQFVFRESKKMEMNVRNHILKEYQFKFAYKDKKNGLLYWKEYKNNK